MWKFDCPENVVISKLMCFALSNVISDGGKIVSAKRGPVDCDDWKA